MQLQQHRYQVRTFSIDFVETAIIAIARRATHSCQRDICLYIGLYPDGPGFLGRTWHDTCSIGKPVHWHIDELTERGIISGNWIVRNGRCDLVACSRCCRSRYQGSVAVTAYAAAVTSALTEGSIGAASASERRSCRLIVTLPPAVQTCTCFPVFALWQRGGVILLDKRCNHEGV